jgi:predicted O-methyltransferase YrrM
MTGTLGEPTSTELVDGWIGQHLQAQDRFAHVVQLSETHRAQHGCDVYPSSSGNLLGILAGALRARRILEVGCGLGYGALWLAWGAGPEARVETIEQDETHAAIARALVRDAGYGEQIHLHLGDSRALLPQLAGPYDLVFYDAAIPGPDDLAQFARLVRRDGLLLTSNIFLGLYVPTHPDLPQGAAYRRQAMENGEWSTAFVGMKAISIRR